MQEYFLKCQSSKRAFSLLLNSNKMIEVCDRGVSKINRFLSLRVIMKGSLISLHKSHPDNRDLKKSPFNRSLIMRYYSLRLEVKIKARIFLAFQNCVQLMKNLFRKTILPLIIFYLISFHSIFSYQKPILYFVDIK